MRIAGLNDLDAVLDIVAKTIEVMRTENNLQWTEEYPALSHFISDVDEKSLYVYEKDGEVIGFICVNQKEEPAYAGLTWSQDPPCFVMHRMAVMPSARREGVGRKLIAFAENYAKERGVCYLRTDTFSKNTGMNILFKKCGFKKTGEVHFRGLPEPFNCYDKIL